MLHVQTINLGLNWVVYKPAEDMNKPSQDDIGYPKKSINTIRKIRK